MEISDIPRLGAKAVACRVAKNQSCLPTFVMEQVRIADYDWVKLTSEM